MVGEGRDSYRLSKSIELGEHKGTKNIILNARNAGICRSNPVNMNQHHSWKLPVFQDFPYSPRFLIPNHSQGYLISTVYWRVQGADIERKSRENNSPILTHAEKAKLADLCSIQYRFGIPIPD